MSAPEIGPRAGGVHRRERGNRLTGLLLSLVVVVLLAGAVVAVLRWRGEGKRPTPPVAVRRPTATATTARPSASSVSPTGTVATSSLPATSGPAVSPQSSALGSPSVISPAPTGASASTSSGSGVRPEVDILNNTHISGLAAGAERTLDEAGWVVAETGNYVHDVSETTVYYQAGELSAAQQLAQQFPKIRRVSPAPAGLSPGRLTLVLAADWQ